FIESLAMSAPLEVSRISSDTEKETIIIYANRAVQTYEEFMIQITYRGVAVLDGNGLYEHWDPKFSKTLDSNEPFILVSNNFPAGARFWFPCFDDPDKNSR
ncbi:hypothetical protein PMAYCL1PPCAC_08605, partial [Pristionchus mayeri]